MKEMIVIGSSAGGIEALKSLLPLLPVDYPAAVAIVQHISADSPQILAHFFRQICQMEVKEAEDKEKIRKGVIYLAPSGYHLMISEEKYFCLTVEEPVKFARPSVDVLFETAALAYKESLVGVILTGANDDGAQGLLAVKHNGGSTLVQDPKTAQFGTMPDAALKVAQPDFIFSIEEIGTYLVRMNQEAGAQL